MNVPMPILKQTRHHAETLYSSWPIAHERPDFYTRPYRLPHIPITDALEASGETQNQRDLSRAMGRTTTLHRPMGQSGRAIERARNDLGRPRRKLLPRKAMPKRSFACGCRCCENHPFRSNPIRLAGRDDVPWQDGARLPWPGEEGIARLKAERTCA